MRRVYVASSWRNARQPEVVLALVEAGHLVYDFRNPEYARGGFHWSDIDPEWQKWTPERFRDALLHPIAVAGSRCDWESMVWADCCVLVMPCGRSAHLEAGYFVGAGKPLVILLSDGEPELMYKMASFRALTIPEAVSALETLPVREDFEDKLFSCGAITRTQALALMNDYPRPDADGGL